MSCARCRRPTPVVSSALHTQWRRCVLLRQQWIHSFLRMRSSEFNGILNEIAGNIMRMDTVMRDSVTPKERLVVTLRYLASGKAHSVCIPGSWFIPRQIRIGRHDSSSSCCPQPIQPRPSWCPFPWDLSWRHFSSSVAAELASSWNLRVSMESFSRKSLLIHSWKMTKTSQKSASDNVFQFSKCSCLSDFLIVTLSFQEIPRIFRCHLWCAASSFFHLCEWDWPQHCTVEQASVLAIFY